MSSPETPEKVAYLIPLLFDIRFVYPNNNLRTNRLPLQVSRLHDYESPLDPSDPALEDIKLMLKASQTAAMQKFASA